MYYLCNRCVFCRTYRCGQADSDLCKQVIYPAAVLKTAEHPDEAKVFLDYLTTDECAEVFEGVGFTIVEAE